MNDTTTTIEIKLSRWYKWAIFGIFMSGYVILLHLIIDIPSPWNWVWYGFLAVAICAGAPNAIDDPADPLNIFKIKNENLFIPIRLVSLFVLWSSMLWMVYVTFLSRAN